MIEDLRWLLYLFYLHFFFQSADGTEDGDIVQACRVAEMEIGKTRPHSSSSDRFNFAFVDTLRSLPSELEFKLVGLVLMPEHFHVLIWLSLTADPS